jgi:mono/diheme cytochrome c family protein
MRPVTIALAVALAAFVLAPVEVARAREWIDATGKFKIQGELVAVRAGKAIIEKADGSIISVPVEKLSTADQEFLKSQSKPATPAPSTPAPPAPATASAPATPQPAPAPVTADGAALAQKVEGVLRTNCYRCHGEEGASEGGFNFALNLPKLAKTLVKPGNASGSVLYQRITASGDDAMPPVGEDPRPAAADIALVKAWIDAGSPAPANEKPREFITNDQVVKYVAADIEKAAERSRRFLRYFTLTHLHNAGVSEDELQTYRNALTKLINSLSWNTDLLVPEALDPARTIFRIDMRDLHWNVAMWEQVEAANPYFLPLATREAQAASDAAQCRMPYIRADWFVFAASKPPLYHVMLGVPETDADLESLLRVNVAANIDQEQAIRAAFNRSGVSQNNRLIEWHKSPYGSYWKSYDFGGNAGRQNLFEYPLGPGSAAGQFQHDGGELIFTLPNGLQGYLLVDEAGRRIDKGPTNIVSDPKQLDKTVTNGVSCMSCHYTGVIPKNDEVGPAVRANPKAYENSEDILALYRKPEDLTAVLDGDAKRFAGAMEKLGVSSLSRSGEPISAMAQRFQQELDLQLAACEFGLSIEEFLKRLDGTDLLSRRFAALRTPGGVLKRDVFATGFGEASVELKLTVEARVTVGPAAPAVASSPSRPAPAPSRSRSSASSSAASSIPAAGGNKPGEVCRFTNLTWGVKSMAFSPNGSLLACGKPDRALRIFSVADQGQVDALDKLEMLQAVESCAFAPNGTRFLACGASGHIMIFEVTKEGQLKEAGQFAGHSKDVKAIAVSADGRFVLSGSDEKKVRYWDLASAGEIAVFAEFEGPIKACHIAKNGRTGMATDGATLLEFNLAGKPEVKRRRQVARSRGQAAAFSADGNYVAVGDGYNIKLWNLNTGKEQPDLEAGELQWSMAFTPDGSRLLSGGTDKVNVWDVRKLKRIHAQAVPDSGYIQCLAASPDNKHAAATGRSDVVVFRLPPAP